MKIHWIVRNNFIFFIHSYSLILHSPLATKFATEMMKLNIHGQTKHMQLKLIEPSKIPSFIVCEGVERGGLNT